MSIHASPQDERISSISQLARPEAVVIASKGANAHGVYFTSALENMKSQRQRSISVIQMSFLNALKEPALKHSQQEAHDA